eukprot:5397045-Prymnesium_polylepis.1
MNGERGGMNGERGGMNGERGGMNGERGGMNGERGEMNGERGGMNGEQGEQQCALRAPPTQLRCGYHTQHTPTTTRDGKGGSTNAR